MPKRSVQGTGSPENGTVGLMEPLPASTPVEPRAGATISPDMVNVFEQAVSPGAAPGLHLVPLGGRPAGDAIALSILAWVRNVAYDKDVWADLFVLDEGDVLHSETVPLAYQEPAEGGGDFFAAGAAVPAPKAGAEGSSRRMLQYRIYGQMSGQLFTDGILHTHEIEATPVKKAEPAAAAPKATAPKATAPKATAPTTTAPKVAARKAAAPKAAAPKTPAAEPAPAATKPTAPRSRKPKKV